MHTWLGKSRAGSGSVCIFLGLTGFPALNHGYEVGYFPATAIHPCGLGWGHTVCAAYLDEVMVHRVEGEGVTWFSIFFENACVRRA